MHVDEVLCHGENGGATWETSRRGCIMRKVVSKQVTAGGRFDFFLDSKLFITLEYSNSKRFRTVKFSNKCMAENFTIQNFYHSKILPAS